MTKELTLRATRLAGGALVIAALAHAVPARAAEPHEAVSPPTTQTEDQRKAQEHFLRARELYHGGSYKEAVAELESARKLDPKAKDLVLNLGIVHEKLGRYDEAIGFLRSYLEMEGVTPAERQKAETMIKRLEGAKQRALPPRETPPQDLVRTPPTPAPPPVQPGPPPAPASPPGNGRVDGYTVTALVVGGLGFVAGASLGIYALAERPENFVTGRDGSYGTLENKTSSAHSAAVAADVFLGLGVLGTAAAAALYFARPRDPRPAASRAPSLRAWAGPGGAAVGVGGRF